MKAESAWVPRSDATAVETAASVRSDLAATYNLLHKFQLNEGACNHLTAMIPGTRDKFLVIRYGLLWSEVTADNLVLVDASGKVLEGQGPVEVTAFEIHRAIHLADPDKCIEDNDSKLCLLRPAFHSLSPFAPHRYLPLSDAAVLHTHMPYATALCCLAGRAPGLVMCHQNSLRFHNDWQFDEHFQGLVMDNTEGDRLAAALRGNRVLLHSNHGVIVCGRSVAEAFDDLYYLERACMHQVLAC